MGLAERAEALGSEGLRFPFTDKGLESGYPSNSGTQGSGARTGPRLSCVISEDLAAPCWVRRCWDHHIYTQGAMPPRLLVERGRSHEFGRLVTLLYYCVIS